MSTVKLSPAGELNVLKISRLLSEIPIREVSLNSVQVLYGRGTVSVAVPENISCQVIRKPLVDPLADPTAAIRLCLEKAFEEDRFQRSVTDAESACIVVCDITRPVPNQLFLRPMIEALCALGVPYERIRILVATGLHRPNVGEELEELIGDSWVLENIRIDNHDASDDQNHVTLGRTPTRNTPVRLNRYLVESDLKIVTGLVEPHFMAGYSGGRKVIAPGVAHSETIRTFHSARFMGDPNASNCNFVGNPLHEEQLEIVKMLGDVFALNTVIDENRRLTRVNFGEVVESHHAMVQRVRAECEVKIGRRFTTVLTSAAGYPLDQTYYQTIKGMVGALGILEPGGDLIIASACSEGFGSAPFRDAQKRLIQLGPDVFLSQLLAKTLASTDEWQTQKQLAPMKHGTVHLYTDGLSADEKFLTGVHCVSDLQSAVEASLNRHSAPSLAVIPEGPYVIPHV